MGETHSIAGRVVDQKIFEIEVPFQNKIGNDLLPDHLKGPKMTLNKISVSPPFELVESTPMPPVEIAYLSKTIFKIKIRAPDLTYEGPLVITFGNELADNVNLNIQGVVLFSKGQKTELENSGMVISMQKGQIFQRTLQLYKIFSLGDTVSTLHVNAPFEMVSTDPKIPLKVDKMDSYILTMFIKAPDYNYAGNLEFTFE